MQSTSKRKRSPRGIATAEVQSERHGLFGRDCVLNILYRPAAPLFEIQTRAPIGRVGYIWPAAAAWSSRAQGTIWLSCVEPEQESKRDAAAVEIWHRTNGTRTELWWHPPLGDGSLGRSVKTCHGETLFVLDDDLETVLEALAAFSKDSGAGLTSVHGRVFQGYIEVDQASSPPAAPSLSRLSEKEN